MTKTIQMTIGENLLADVDRAVAEMGISRSQFIHNALQNALHQHAIEKIDAQHAQGYAQHPPREEDVTEWANARDWG